MTTIFLYLAVYILPAHVIFYTALETFFRNPRKTEYRLMSLILLAGVLMFVEEFVRQLLPATDSPFLVAYLFGNLGAISSALIIHFYLYITGWTNRIPARLYLPLSYLPVVPVILTLLLRHNLYNSTDFTRIGLWVQPTYNLAYYIAIWIGIFIIVLMAVVIYRATRKASSALIKRRLSVVFYGTVFSGVWHIIFGGFAGVIPGMRYLPPYMYIYGFVGWLLLVRWAMFRHDFLPSYEKKYRALFDLAPTAILVVDESGHVAEANPKARHLFGYGEFNLYDLVLTERQDQVRSWLTHHFHAMSRVEDEDVQFVRHDGTSVSAVVDTVFVEVDNQELLLVIIRDLTERIVSEQKIRQLAFYDSLTELPNRMHFYRLLHEATDKAQSTGEQFGVMLLDMDNFKQVNDSYGHLVGDDVIRHVGQVLKESLPEGDVAARLGGDEFVTIVHKVSSREYMTELAEVITANLSTPYTVQGHTIYLGASIGCSLYPDDAEIQHDLIKNADMAMYSAKQMGKIKIPAPPAQ